VSRIHGRNGRVYMNLTSAGTAEPVAFLSSWSINFEVDKEEVTAFGDVNKIYVAGLPDASGEFSGFYDDASTQTYTAASDGIARKFYLYPSTNAAGQYWWGTVFPDFKVNGAVAGAVEISSSWNAGSTIAKVG
jgi:hypothetical protein